MIFTIIIHTMKKIILSFVTLIVSTCAYALGPDIFNHLGAGLGVGTNGISVELGTKITPFVTMRAGVHFMPSIKFHTDANAYYTLADASIHSTEINIEGDLGRTQGSVIFNAYPVPKIPFFIAAGAFFGGKDLIKVKGHSNEFVGHEGGSLEIGDYNIPIDSEGNARGGLEVKSFRPYLGIGYGNFIPSKLLNFNIELGIQFQQKPKVYTANGELTQLVTEEDPDNTIHDIQKYLKVYPCLTFRLSGKIF